MAEANINIDLNDEPSTENKEELTAEELLELEKAASKFRLLWCYIPLTIAIFTGSTVRLIYMYMNNPDQYDDSLWNENFDLDISWSFTQISLI